MTTTVASAPKGATSEHVHPASAIRPPTIAVGDHPEALIVRSDLAHVLALAVLRSAIVVADTAPVASCAPTVRAAA